MPGRNKDFSIDRLKKYYKKCGISALKFNCKHYKDCRSKCENISKFTTAREPYIGEYYGKKGIPRLLFLSLDSGDADKDPKDRTIHAMRKGCMNLTPDEIVKPRHWYRTNQFAWVIFDELNKLSKSKWDIGHVNKKMDFDPKEQIHKIKPYFAHTNSAKCCMNNIHAKQANKRLFDNCRDYIPDEIRIFNPHIIITQGLMARKAIGESTINGTFTVKKQRNISKASGKLHDLMIIEINGNTPALWIHHYHPSNYGTFVKNFDKYRAYAKEAAKFIKNNCPELL